jgi:hypothetical protein
MLRSNGYDKNEVHQVISKFKALSAAELFDIIESTKEKKDSLEDYCEILKMKRTNERP